MYVSVFEKIQNNKNDIIKGKGQIIDNKACIKKILRYCSIA